MINNGFLRPLTYWRANNVCVCCSLKSSSCPGISSALFFSVADNQRRALRCFWRVRETITPAVRNAPLWASPALYDTSWRGTHLYDDDPHHHRHMRNAFHWWRFFFTLMIFIHQHNAPKVISDDAVSTNNGFKPWLHSRTHQFHCRPLNSSA